MWRDPAPKALIATSILYRLLTASLRGSRTGDPPASLPVTAMTLAMCGAAAFFLVRAMAPRRPAGPLTAKSWNASLAVAILAWAFSEAVAIFGLILFLLGGSFHLYLAFAAASLLLFAIHRPSAFDPPAGITSA